MALQKPSSNKLDIGFIHASPLIYKIVDKKESKGFQTKLSD